MKREQWSAPAKARADTLLSEGLTHRQIADALGVKYQRVVDYCQRKNRAARDGEENCQMHDIAACSAAFVKAGKQLGIRV